MTLRSEKKNFGKGSFAKRISVLMLALILAVAAAMPAFAASRKKITGVKVEVTAHIQPDQRVGSEDIEVEVGSGNYSYDYYEVENDAFAWSENDIPVVTIYLRADDGYYFAFTKGSDVDLKGATYVKATKEDSSETLALQVQLDPLDEAVAELETVTLTDSGYVYWDPVRGAGIYELRVYRDGSLVGTTDIRTEATEYNLKDYMNKAGSYTARVRADNAKKPENKTDWVESSVVTISAERANEIREGLSFTRPLKGDWEHTDAGWVYRYEDGSIHEPGWAEIENHWFYFDDTGIMATGWRTIDGEDYYFEDVTGRMLTSTTTPDGYVLDSEGHKKTE